MKQAVLQFRFFFTLFTYIFVYFYFACAGSVLAHRLLLVAAHQGLSYGSAEALEHTGSLAVAFGLSSLEACESLALRPGIGPALEGGFFTARASGKSPRLFVS